MGAMKNEILTACYQVVASAVNGTYQGILITVAVAAILRLLRRTNAATRYAVWFGTLLLLALLIPAHGLRSWRDDAARVAALETPVSAPASAPDSDVMRMETSSTPDNSDGEPDYLAADAPGNNSASDAEYISGQQYSDFAASDGSGSQSSEDPLPPFVRSILQDAASNGVRKNAPPAAGFLPNIKQKLRWLGERAVTPLPSVTITPKTSLFVAALFPMIWLALAGTKLSFLAWRLFGIRRLKLNSAEPKPELNALFLSLCKNLGVRRNVNLKVSTDCKSPVVLGFFKPVILLPTDSGLETSEHVLRHELAHVRRRDDWANLIQHCIKAVFFFHPAILWVSKRISLEREIACDDQVLQSAARPKAYALLLADLAGRMQPSVLAPGVSTNQSQLKQRIDMILNTNRNTSPRLAKAKLGLLATAGALLAVAAIYAAPRLAFAQSADAAAPAALALPGAPAAPAATAAPTAEIAVSPDIALTAPPDAPSALPVAPSVAPGPKFKPGGAVSVDVRPTIAPHPYIAILTAPSADVAPTASVALTPPVPVAPLVASAGPAPEPRQPETPRPARRPGRDSSLEERLDRLEKMVESLVAQQKGHPGHFEFSPNKPPGEMKFNWKDSPGDGKQWEQAQPDFAKKQAEFELKQADMQKHLAEFDKQRAWNEPKLKELAEQQAKMAADQAQVAEQAAREAQRAARDAQRGRTIHKPRAGSHQELDALHKQREMLEKQMEKLDRQIENLERDQEQLEEQRGKEQDVDIREDQSNSNSDPRTEPSNNVPAAPAAR